MACKEVAARCLTPGVGAGPRRGWVLPVAGAVCVRTVSNSASEPDAPIVATAFALAMVLGLLDYYVETEAGGVEMLVC